MKINNVLGNLALPLIIFVDDVDRLDVGEIQSLFKILKLTADFNNLIYVIALDEDMVSKALSKNYGSGDITDGKNFLEKIVQLPLRIPYINPQEKFEYSISLFNEWLDKNNIDATKKYLHPFVKHFRSLHDSFIDTPRDSKRLLNSVSFSYQCLKNEINVLDIILLETIRIFSPLVFDHLIDYKHHLFSNYQGENGYAIRTQIDDIGKKFVEKISDYSHAVPAIQGAIDFLFPFNKIFNVGYETYQSESQEDLFKYQRVGIQKYFDRFIEFKIGSQDISDAEFKSILEKINTDDFSSLQPETKRLCHFQRQSILTLLSHFREKFTTKGRINTAKIICTIEHFFKQTSVEDRMFNRQIWFSFELLNQLEVDVKIETLKFIVLNCEKTQYSSLIILEAQRGFGSMHKMKFEPQSALDDIGKEFIQKVQQAPIENLFRSVDEEKNYILFEQIKQFGNVELLKSELEKFISEKAENVVMVFKSLISMHYINFSEIGVYPAESPIFSFNAIEEYVTREIIVNQCYLLFPELKNEIPEDFLGRQDISTDKRLVIQYLNFAVVPFTID